VHMNMTVTTIPHQTILHVVGQGDFTLDAAMRTFLEIVSAVDEHKSEKVLFDGRHIIGEPTIIERFYYGEFAADAVTQLTESHGYLNNPPFAYVLLPPVLDPAKLGETVATNRGMNVKVFDNMQEAIKWLKLAPADVEYFSRIA